MHAVGFFHEQSRPDRDEHVTINLGNVVKGMKHNFMKYSLNQVELETKVILRFAKISQSGHTTLGPIGPPPPDNDHRGRESAVQERS